MCPTLVTMKGFVWVMNRMRSGVAVSKDGQDGPATRVSSSALLPNSLKTILVLCVFFHVLSFKKQNA